MDHIGRLRAHRREHALGRGDVVGGERRLVEAADLRMRQDHDVGVGDRRLPAVVARKIGLDHGDVRMQPAQDRGVGAVLVERDDVAVPARLQSRDQVLPDEPGGAGERDL